MYANSLALNLVKNLNLQSTAFVKVVGKEGKANYAISLYEFYYACNEAVKKFYDDIDKVVPYGATGKRFH